MSGKNIDPIRWIRPIGLFLSGVGIAAGLFAWSAVLRERCAEPSVRPRLDDMIARFAADARRARAMRYAMR